MTGLPADLRALVRLSAAVARGEGLDGAIDEAAAVADPVEVEEALLQTYLFVGYPIALNAFGRWRERTGRPPPEPTADADDPRAALLLWQERGEGVCAAVYGTSYGRLRKNVRALHPDMETWMIVEGYGKVLGRPGLAVTRRELCVVAVLAPAGAACHPQLHAHLRGALRVGVPANQVEATLEEALAGMPRSSRAEAFDLWRRIVASS